jgi:(p)ppGpp synthase/HD superfamily hydrolase
MVTDAAWSALEAWLSDVAMAGLERKSSGPLAAHSIRMGRTARAAGKDDVTVFGCYGHDVLEDTSITHAELMAEALTIFSECQETEALAAVKLCVECCYTEEEYKMERKRRKAVASVRWIGSSDPRVWDVKLFDIQDNRADVVSAEFTREYRSWTDPLHDGLMANVARAISNRIDS